MTGASPSAASAGAPSTFNPSRVPMPVGSMPYSAGNTVVTRTTAATAMATAVALSKRPVDRRDWGCSWITDMESPRKLRNEEAGELVADQHETGGNQHGVGRENLAGDRIAEVAETPSDEEHAASTQLHDQDAVIQRKDV